MPLRKTIPHEFYACGGRRFRVAATSGTLRQPRPRQPKVSQMFPPREEIFSVNNYLREILLAAAATKSVTNVFPREKLTLKIYCCYCK